MLGSVIVAVLVVAVHETGTVSLVTSSLLAVERSSTDWSLRYVNDCDEPSDSALPPDVAESLNVFAALLMTKYTPSADTPAPPPLTAMIWMASPLARLWFESVTVLLPVSVAARRYVIALLPVMVTA